MGRNGMGKTTLMKSLMGILPDQERLGEHGRHRTVARCKSYERVAKGLAYVPQGRMIFSAMTVEGEHRDRACRVRARAEVPDEIYELFPVLLEMKRRRGGNLSGGQQQQLAIARALATKPKVLLLDEPTEGIQPSIIKEMARTLKRIRDERGLSIVVSEQVLSFALDIADRRARHRERRDRPRRAARGRRCRADLEISVRLTVSSLYMPSLTNRGASDARNTDQGRSHASRPTTTTRSTTAGIPDIPMVAWVNPGDDFIIETYDWTGGFIKNNDSADDVRDIDLSIVHFLSGPIGVEGRRARRPAGGRSARRRPAEGEPVGLQRLLLQEERRRLPDRSLPAGAEVDLGHQGHLHVSRGTFRA